MVDKFEYMKKEILKDCNHIISLINSYKIDVLLISSEYEISWFSKYKDFIELKTKAKILVAPKKWIEKVMIFKTYLFLKY